MIRCAYKTGSNYYSGGRKKQQQRALLSFFAAAATTSYLFCASSLSSSSSSVVVSAMTSTSASASKTCSNNDNKQRPAALIFLHGLGDTPAGWSGLEDQLPTLQPSLRALKYVFPPAPTIGITINGGVEMPGWFDLYDWPIGVGSRDDADGILKAVRQIENEVEKLNQAGVPNDRIVLGGFSQGGAVAMVAAYHNNNKNEKQSQPPYAGCVSLSGWLTCQDDFMAIENISQQAKANTPLFWGHGEWDDKVLFEQQHHGVSRLLSDGDGLQHVEHERYPMGHASHPQEMKDMAAFLDRILFSSPSATTAATTAKEEQKEK